MLVLAAAPSSQLHVSYNSTGTMKVTGKYCMIK
jgi:hypothetical protein